MALQHLRSSTANKRPVPGNMSEGQLAMNTASGSPGLFFKDSNANLVKVGPVHVGTTAPNASPASGGTAGNSVGEQWLDTSSSRYVFKIWDGSAWRSEDGEFVNASGDVMTGALGVIAGTAGSPGLYFSGDTNTGVYSPGADQVAISTNGAGRLFVDASGRVGVGTTSPDVKLHVATGNATGYIKIDGGTSTSATTGLQFRAESNNYSAEISSYQGNLQFITGVTERARIDSSGRLLVGTSSTSSNTTLLLQGYSGTTGPGVLRCCTTTNGPTSTEDLGYIMFGDATHVNAAWIQAQRDGGTWTAGSSYPGRLVFSVTADGASSPTEAMRIKNSRILNFANTPTYADNTAAKAGGLVDGDVYRKSDGTLMIVYT
jgi:hypothetical protein